MKKEYKIRGKLKVVNELDNVRAIKAQSKSDEFFKSVQKTYDTNAKIFFKNLRSQTPGSNEQLNAFSKAGWVFVQPNATSVKALDNRKFQVEGMKSSNKVYQTENNEIVIATDKINLKLKKELTATEVAEFLKTNELEKIQELKFAPNLFEVRIGKKDVVDVVNILDAMNEVVYAEPQMITHIDQRQRYRPADPCYGQQWHLSNNGSVGQAGADINAENAWTMAKGRGVRIALIDNGFDVNHHDLQPVDNASGYFISNGRMEVFNNSLQSFPGSDHGTFCAGMAIARNNAVGGCGAAFQADFIAIACLEDQVGTQATLARAIAYAADPTTELSISNPPKGADVITCSLGPNGANWTMESVLQDAIDYAIQNGRNGKGTPVFWAVSNGNYPIKGAHDVDEVSAYDNVIAVGRSDCHDIEGGSAYGKELDFLAPGVDVFSTKDGNKYGTWTGTSFAAPLAAGVAAVVLSYKPNKTWIQVRDILRNSCAKIGGVNYVNGHHDKYGYGRIDMDEAINIA